MPEFSTEEQQACWASSSTTTASIAIERESTIAAKKEDQGKL
jgi:hypothetical protein